METRDIGEQRKALLRFIRRRFASTPGIGELSEDIVNQAYREVLSSQSGRPLVGNLGYMATAAVHAAFRMLGEREPAPGPGEGGGAAPGESPRAEAADRDSPGPADELLAAEAAREVSASLDTLCDLDREILELRYFEGLGFREICLRTGLKLNTALSRHRRALERLRPRLSAYFPERAGAAEPPLGRGEPGRFESYF